MPAVMEDGRSFAENAERKARALSRARRDELVVADDSGLEVAALGGAPGIFSARFAGENATDPENVEKLLSELGDETKREARFCCALALALNGKVVANFLGDVLGRITNAPSGRDGFGYDPVFVPDGYENTFAELGEIKNQISHRAHALAQLRKFLFSFLRSPNES